MYINSFTRTFVLRKVTNKYIKFKMNTLKDGKTKRLYSKKLQETSSKLIEKVTDFIPYNYVAQVKDILRNNNSKQIELEGINRRIHHVRKGLIGDIEIAKALYKIGLEEKNKIQELEILADN